jgi:hypothetical protein
VPLQDHQQPGHCNFNDDYNNTPATTPPLPSQLFQNKGGDTDENRNQKKASANVKINAVYKANQKSESKYMNTDRMKIKKI